MPLTDELKSLIRAMVSANDGTPGMAPDDFLAAAGIDDGSAFAHRTLVGSLAARDGEGVDLSMVLLEKFGGTLADVEPLLALTGQDWHSSSNEAFFRLEAIGRPEAIGPLRRIAQTPPRPFQDDLDERTLANNAVYSIAPSIRSPGSVGRRLTTPWPTSPATTPWNGSCSLPTCSPG